MQQDEIKYIQLVTRLPISCSIKLIKWLVVLAVLSHYWLSCTENSPPTLLASLYDKPAEPSTCSCQQVSNHITSQKNAHILRRWHIPLTLPHRTEIVVTLDETGVQSRYAVPILKRQKGESEGYQSAQYMQVTYINTQSVLLEINPPTWEFPIGQFFFVLFFFIFYGTGN